MRRFRFNNIIKAVLVASVATLTSIQAIAQIERTWLIAGDGSFHVDTNWDPFGVPQPLDWAFFEVGSVHTVTLSADVINELMRVDSDDLTLEMPSLTYTLNGIVVGNNAGNTGILTIQNGTMSVLAGLNLFVRVGKDPDSFGDLMVTGAGTFSSTDGVFIGDAGTGSLQITAGGSVSTAGVIVADDAFSEGNVLLQDAGSSWVNVGSITIGNSGFGTLDVSNGASLSTTSAFIADNFGSTGIATLDGAGSTWDHSASLFMGNGGNGTLSITNGGVLTASGQISVGDDALSNGNMTIDGAGSIATCNGAMTVGNFGTGTINIINGGMSTWGGLTRIGDELGANGTVNVTGSGSLLTINGETRVGKLATGTVNITAGGELSTTRVKVGDDVGSTGIVTVDGAGSTWTDSLEIIVGNFSNGTLTVTNGGTVSGVLGKLGDDIGSTGTATISGAGSSWTSSGTLIVGNFGSATVSVNTGGTVSASSVSINTTSTLEGDGTVIGDVSNTGTVAPGNAIGTLTTQGNYTQTASGILNIDLNIASADQLAVAGTATLAGTLNINLANGFVPGQGDTFDILTASNIVGTFSTFNAPPLDGSLNWQLNYNANSVQLEVIGSGSGITDISIITGVIMDGGIPEIITSDDTYVHTRSGFGNTFIDLHNMEIMITGTIPADNPLTVDIAIESRINQVAGIAQVRVKNFLTTNFDMVDSYSIGQTESVRNIAGLDAGKYYNPNNGRVRLRVKHLVFVPFFAFTFQSYFDQVEIIVN